MKKTTSLCLLLLISLSCCNCKYAWVTWHGNEAKVSASNAASDIPHLHVARATYKNDINSTGWAYLELHTTADSSDEKQAYAAGYLEGFLTRDLIWMHWQNMLKGYCYNKTDICSLIDDFVDKNEDYISSMVQSHPTDPYWYQVKLYYIQLEGLAVGYNQATEDIYQRLSVRDLIWINMLGDLDELAFALSIPVVPAEGLLFASQGQLFSADGLLFPEHCTGLVKLLPDLSNLYTSHVTWNSYQSMLRIQKMYVMHLKISPCSDKVIPGYKMSMTSYPGMVQSTDDFVITSAGLVAAETTIGNSNRTLFEDVKPVGQLLEYVRAVIALRLARDGKEWTDIFRKHNSGTYNNQWYIVDYNKFVARSAARRGALRPGLLWVLEQLPGYTQAADLTDLLVKQSYFPSYNIPYFERVFNLSGGPVRVQTYGDWFGYKTNPRAKIMHLKQAEVKDLASMFLMMRYNDYKHDPMAACAQCRPPYSACNAIAARNDLNPPGGVYPFRALGHRSHGGTDAKVTSAELVRSYRFVAVSSPTHNVSRGIPPFTWSKFDMGSQVSHIGHPDLWVFPPVLHLWEWQ